MDTTARVLLSDPDVLEETAAKQFRGIGCATDRLRTRRGGRQKYGAARPSVLAEFDSAGNKITYHEWDVNPIKGINRGAERLVTGSDGSAYCTGDHYQTYTQLQR